MNLNGLFAGFLNEPKKTLAIALVVLCSFLLIWEIFSFFQQKNTLGTAQPPLTRKMEEEIINEQSQVFKVMLFGKYQAPLSDVEIKESRLDLEIVGIMFSTDPKLSQVLIRSSGGEEQLYMKGSILPGGAEIRQINKKGIVVLYRGSLESLSLPQNELLFDKPAKPLIGE